MGKKRTTPKDDAFLHLILAGWSYTNAYQAVFDTAKYTKRSMTKNASILFNQPHMQERYQEIRNKMDEAAIEQALWTRDEAFVQLQKVTSFGFDQIEQTKDIRGVGNIINSNIQVLNKMFGIDVAVKDEDQIPNFEGIEYLE